MAQCSGRLLSVLALEFSGLNLSFLGLKFVWWYGSAEVREMLKKGTDSRSSREWI